MKFRFYIISFFVLALICDSALGQVANYGQNDWANRKKISNGFTQIPQGYMGTSRTSLNPDKLAVQEVGLVDYWRFRVIGVEDDYVLLSLGAKTYHLYGRDKRELVVTGDDVHVIGLVVILDPSGYITVTGAKNVSVVMRLLSRDELGSVWKLRNNRMFGGEFIGRFEKVAKFRSFDGKMFTVDWNSLNPASVLKANKIADDAKKP